MWLARRELLRVHLTSMHQASLLQRRSVVIDNTNVTRAHRARFLELGRQHGVRVVRVLWFQTPLLVCKHLNAIRHYESGGVVKW